MKIPPRFNGWRALNLGEITAEKDVFVCIRNGPADIHTSPFAGDPIKDFNVGKSCSAWEDSGWWIYRREKGEAVARRLALNNPFSKPLPLP